MDYILLCQAFLLLLLGKITHYKAYEVLEEMIERDTATLEKQFLAAVEFIQMLPKDGPVKTPIPDQLVAYSLYKQATIGPCNTKKPSLIHPIERIKWNAWNDLGTMSIEEAKISYIEKFIERCEKNYEKHATEIPDWLQDERYSMIKDWALKNWTVFGVTELRQSNGRTIEISVIAKDFGIEMQVGFD